MTEREKASPKEGNDLERPSVIQDGHGVDPKLLEILVCPITKDRLDYNAENQELISRSAGLAFPIRKGVPLMTKEAARELTEAELAKIKATRT